MDLLVRIVSLFETVLRIVQNMHLFFFVPIFIKHVKGRALKLFCTMCQGFINDHHNQGIFTPHPPLRKFADEPKSKRKGGVPVASNPVPRSLYPSFRRKSLGFPGDQFAYQGKRQWYVLACSPPVSHLRQLSLRTFIRFNHR